MEDVGPTLECEVCGSTDFYKEAGHFYCNECQTQTQEVQEHVFDQEETALNNKSSKVIQKGEKKQREDALTSWECYNLILRGLTHELIELGAKPELKTVVKCLWMKYLHKCEVFNVASNQAPKVSVLGSRKDIAILHNVKKRKRRTSGSSASTTTLSVRRQRSKKKQALIHSHYEDLSQTQSLTQESSLTAETLSSLKNSSEKSDGITNITYNRYSNSELKRIMSKTHQKKHKADIEGTLTCHKFRVRDFRPKFARGPTVLTPVTLYSILYIALLIIKDPIQLSDFLRFIREGHISFSSYRHFFEEHLSDKLLNLPRTQEKIFGKNLFRQKSAKVAQFLEVTQYINKPNITELCKRYCKELNLPEEIFHCAEKLIKKTGPKMPFNKGFKEIPNYEGRAMSFVVFVLKLLFSLDGVSETTLSEYAKKVNLMQQGRNMFDFQEWVKYIGYRHKIVQNDHIITSLRNCDNVDSDKYLDYLKNQQINFKAKSKYMHSEVKDYYQILTKLVSSTSTGPKFSSSLTPFLNYAELIVDNKEIFAEETLKTSFSTDSIDFILRPNKYLELVGNNSVNNRGANNNIITEDPLHIHNSTKYFCNKNKKTVTVHISDQISNDLHIQEFLDIDKKPSLRCTDINILLDNWQKSHQTRFDINKNCLKIASQNVSIDKTSHQNQIYKEHFNTFERYWLNIPSNPGFHQFTKAEMDKLMSKLSLSFKIILKECSRLLEQNVGDFYAEFLITELYLVYVDDKTHKSNWDFKKVLKSCRKKW